MKEDKSNKTNIKTTTKIIGLISLLLPTVQIKKILKILSFQCKLTTPYYCVGCGEQ